MEGLAAFLQEEESVMAVRLNPEDRTISVATSGEFSPKRLEEKLTTVIRELDAKFVSTSPANPGAKTESGSMISHDGLLLKKASQGPGEWRWRKFPWPVAVQVDDDYEWKRMALEALVCGILLVVGFVLDKTGHAGWPMVICYAVSMAAGGVTAAGEAWHKMWQRRLDIHFLMIAVAVAASSIGAWREGALLLFLFSTSGAVEHYVLQRTRREISALTKSMPKTAHVILENGALETRPVTLLKTGDLIQVLPDEMHPVDGIVHEGETASDESNITGESVPVEKAEGASVLGGTLNLWGSVKVRVEKPASQSTLQRIIVMIEQAENLRAPSQRFTDRFGTHYTLGVLALTTVMFLIWWLVLRVPPFANTVAATSAFYRAMTLLVVMSPCALALSIPSAILAAIAWGARHGLLFRGGAAVEKLAEVDVICMDKTGTLTEGVLKVRQVESFPAGHEERIARIAVTLDSQSNHPISRAISSYGKEHHFLPDPVEQFQRIPGMGLRGRIKGAVCYVGRRELLEQQEFAHWLTKVPDTPLALSEVWVLGEGMVGRILLEDTIREGSRDVLRQLKERGIQSIMLTGDRRAAAEQVAAELGVDVVRAGLHPEDKVRIIQELSTQGKKVAMVGDGVNDAPSLAAAHVSVAMGARGSDAAMEQSDIVLMKDRIEKLLTALDLSRRARAIIRQNLAISLGAIALASLASMASLLPLTVGVIAHEGSTLIVCLNSLRLIFRKE